MPYLFTSESVSEGHPDKIADQVSDTLVDNFLAQDPTSKVACETLVTTGLVVISGEVKTNAYLDVQALTRKTISEIGYNDAAYMFEANSCGVINTIHEQSPDINRGVDTKNTEEQGAGDQGIMFGYAVKETEDYMPISLDLSHKILIELAEIRKKGEEMTYLRPDSKAQVTVEYDDAGKPTKINTIVVSTQHDDFDTDVAMQKIIRDDVINILIPRVKKYYKQEVQELFHDTITYHVNPTGNFVIGGPHGDAGLTGRKIIVDTYGGKGSHGGGAFSGKDPSKVDRSATYAVRHIAKNCVAAGLAEEMLVQVSYAIGVAKPVGFFVNTYGTSNISMTDAEIAEILPEIFEMTPAAIIKRLKLLDPIYRETAAYGHFGRTPKVVQKEFKTSSQGTVKKEVELFTWEKLDYVSNVKERFKL